MTNLDESQKRTVAGWIAEGLKLSDIQKRLSAELGVNVTYMEVRLLVDDLKLTPKDAEPPKTAELPGTASAPAHSAPGTAPATSPLASPLAAPPAPGAGVSVSLDDITRPGAVASGKVSFSDGNRAEWYLDQSGRLGLMPEQPGYRPSPQDVQAFQSELQNQLSRFGM